ncbi:AI-2E family transporter [candidate division KSB1 bacterium]
MQKTEKYDIDRIFRMFLSFVGIIVFFSLVYYLRNILVPFVIAFIIAYVLDPVIDFIEKFHIPRIIAILIVFALAGLLLFILFFYGTPYVISELEAFGEVFPSYIQDIYEFAQSKIALFSQSAVSSEYADKLIENIQASGFFEKIVGYLTNIFTQLLNVIYLLVALVIIIMYVFFLLRDIDRIKERWHYYLPEKYRENIRQFLKEAYYYTEHFFRGQLTIVTILGILFAIGFTIVDIRLSIIFGFTAGFLNLIPNFGTITAIFPGILLAVGRAAEDGSSPLLRIGGVLLVFLVVQLIQDIILTPTIMGKKTGLRPATILFSVLIWGKLLGFLGIILAIPLTCITKVYFARFILKDKSIPDYTKKG